MVDKLENTKAGADGAGAEGKKDGSGTDVARLPDDHPLVTALAAQKAELKELKAKIATLAESESKKSKTDADRLAALEAELAATKLDKLRTTVAARHGIPEADANLLLTGIDEATLTAQAKRLALLGHADPDAGAPAPAGVEMRERLFKGLAEHFKD